MSISLKTEWLQRTQLMTGVKRRRIWRVLRDIKYYKIHTGNSVLIRGKKSKTNKKKKQKKNKKKKKKSQKCIRITEPGKGHFFFFFILFKQLIMLFKQLNYLVCTR